MRKKLQESGLSGVKIEKEIEVLIEKKPIYKKRKDLAYKILCDRHKVSLEIQYRRSGQEEGQFTLVKDFQYNEALVNIRGYIVYIAEPWETKNSSLMTVMHFIDETGYASIAVFDGKSDLIGRVQNSFQKLPVAAYIYPINTKIYNDKNSVSMPPFAKWEKIGVDDYELPDINKALANLSNSTTEFIDENDYLFHGFLSDFGEGGGYKGCPLCKKGTPDLKEGILKVRCEKCGNEITPKDYKSTNAMISDEWGELGFGFNDWTDVDQSYLRALREADPQPEVIIGGHYTEKYGLSGNWILPLGDIEIEAGTGKKLITVSIDSLDFSCDEGKEAPDEATLEVMKKGYIDKLKYMGVETPEELQKHLVTTKTLTKKLQVKPFVKFMLAEVSENGESLIRIKDNGIKFNDD